MDVEAGVSNNSEGRGRKLSIGGPKNISPTDLRVKGGVPVDSALSIRSPITHIPAHSSLVMSPNSQGLFYRTLPMTQQLLSPLGHKEESPNKKDSSPNGANSVSKEDIEKLKMQLNAEFQGAESVNAKESTAPKRKTSPIAADAAFVGAAGTSAAVGERASLLPSASVFVGLDSSTEGIKSSAGTPKGKRKAGSKSKAKQDSADTATIRI